ncbi:hypothetical protein BDQ12DRAFT_641058 [Crucibulum laeve]|uniref:C2H2-type domain-containing protein n=1 Tax=Crucibulum laeve TaxID=68775 RepID=A0A5C3MIC3_9AGAR|nr:hypothetical protein BDQ12DRAFT_641058 [Crucibulum laeve]
MTDRRHSQYSSSVHWSTAPQQYPSANHYSASGYHHSTNQQYAPIYDGQGIPVMDTSRYYAGHSSFSPPSSPAVAHQVYSPPTHIASSNMSGIRQPSIPRPQSTHPQPHPYHMHSHSQSYSQRQSSPPSQTRPRSHSQAQAYLPSSSPTHHSIHYPTQASLSQLPEISSQYPASPPRPFSCDLCALSFNRQHDLKRHKETHTGEKPYLCNGGCGKTFTRKDALKRHQLVKGCGKVDDAWP